MSESPISALLEAFDALDIDRVASLAAPDVRLLTADGQRAEGREAVRAVLARLAAGLRSTSHRILAEWQQDDVWIAEVESDYELRDWLRVDSLPRAFILRDGPDGFSELHVYGAHEHPLAEHRTGEEGMWIGDRWIPPL